MAQEMAPQTAQAIEFPCRRLRSKEMYIDSEHDPTVPNSHSGLFWCMHSQNCLGPDGEIVTLGDCKSGRACFEAM